MELRQSHDEVNTISPIVWTCFWKYTMWLNEHDYNDWKWYHAYACVDYMACTWDDVWGYMPLLLYMLAMILFINIISMPKLSKCQDNKA